jgi:hypothetical protein
VKLQRRLARLEERVPPPDPEKELRQKRWSKIVARFFQQMEQATTLLTPDEERRVEQALKETADGELLDGSIGIWLRDLQSGWCRLPKLSAAVMKDLVLVWSTVGVTGGVTCKCCGLEYPHREFHVLLDACPLPVLRADTLRPG